MDLKPLARVRYLGICTYNQLQTYRHTHMYVRPYELRSAVLVYLMPIALCLQLGSWLEASS